MIVVSKFWTIIFSFGRANAVTIFPFIFVKYPEFESNEVLLNHERIHLRQAVELGVVIFYIWYLFEFIVRFIQFRQFDKAYRNISFEREAYCNESDTAYLSKRMFLSVFKYVKNRG